MLVHIHVSYIYLENMWRSYSVYSFMLVHQTPKPSSTDAEATKQVSLHMPVYSLDVRLLFFCTHSRWCTHVCICDKQTHPCHVSILARISCAGMSTPPNPGVCTICLLITHHTSRSMSTHTHTHTHTHKNTRMHGTTSVHCIHAQTTLQP